MAKRRVLVIDDDAHVCEGIRQMAERQGCDVVAVTRARDFRAALDSFRPDVIMIDVVMPDTDGVELLKYLSAHGCTARVVMMTGYSPGYLSKAVDLGHGLGLPWVAGLMKPLGLGELRKVLAPMARSATPA